MTTTYPSGSENIENIVEIASLCQWTSETARGRTWELPVGGR
jgi:hypothetical protein